MLLEALAGAFEELRALSVQVTVTAGKHHYREESSPHYTWEVIALRVPGECYPPFHQSDDLLDAITNVIEQLKT